MLISKWEQLCEISKDNKYYDLIFSIICSRNTSYFCLIYACYTYISILLHLNFGHIFNSRCTLKCGVIRGWCLCRSNRERIRPDIIPVFMSMVWRLWEEIRYPISVLPFLWALWACLSTAWKVSKYGIFSGPYFPAFRQNKERYSVYLVTETLWNVTAIVINNFLFSEHSLSW